MSVGSFRTPGGAPAGSDPPARYNPPRCENARARPGHFSCARALIKFSKRIADAAAFGKLLTVSVQGLTEEIDDASRVDYPRRRRHLPLAARDLARRLSGIAAGRPG